MASPATSPLPSPDFLSASIPQVDGQFSSRPRPMRAASTPLSSLSASVPSSPESRPADLPGSIPEEEEDETGSEAATEPVTPTDSLQAHEFHHTSHEAPHFGPHVAAHHMESTPPFVVKTPATPTRTDASRNIAPATKSPVPPHTLPHAKLTFSSRGEQGIKRGLSQFFRRSNSHMGVTPANAESVLLPHGIEGLDYELPGAPRPMSLRRMSASTSTNTSRSNTPPSPGSPKELTLQPQTARQEPAQEPGPLQFLTNAKKNRSATGLGLRNKLHGITFSTPAHKEPAVVRHRSSSVDLETGIQHSNKSSEPELTRNPWAFPPEEGTGLKARRMSVNLPDDFTIDVVELHKEFSDQSRILGRRGKMLGKGATSKVTLMTRKGGSSELYAVKEFRGKKLHEKKEDYEKKVKSEYSIAKSLHHPNIVESIRLCTHQGRWNHVMEYCQEGDLFNLVHKGYLRREERLPDRLCLFKQLIQAVNYLHSHGIAHRDIKLENLLVTSQSKLKITDFGVSEVFSGIHPGLRAAGGECGRNMKEVKLCAPGICGSMPYIAPEVVDKKGEYDPRPLDVWSSAIVMLHIVFGGALWPRAEAGHRNYDMLLKGWAKWDANHPDGSPVTESDYPYVCVFDQMVNPPALRRLLVRMLHPDPTKRITIADVIKNRWLKNVDCCQIDSYDDPSTTIDASKRNCCRSGAAKVVQHNHLPHPAHKNHYLI